MAHPHVITALVRKYRQLSGRLVVCEKDAAAIRADLTHLDAAIRIFNPDYNTAGIPPKRAYRPSKLFRHGSLSRAALEILRTAPGPMTASEIVCAALRDQGVETPDAATIQRLRNSLNSSLARRERDGLVVGYEDVMVKRWEIATESQND